jgi:hypothetical protein
MDVLPGQLIEAGDVATLAVSVDVSDPSPVDGVEWYEDGKDDKGGGYEDLQKGSKVAKEKVGI